jgi:hypothetical protein
VLRAAQLATERRETCLREGRSLAFETAFSAVDKPAFVRQADPLVNRLRRKKGAPGCAKSA